MQDKDRLIEILNNKVETLEKEVFRLREIQSESEKIWINVFRVIGIFIFLLPFIPITLGYIDSSAVKVEISAMDWMLIGGGFFFVWGGKQFGQVVNTFFKWLNKKLGVDGTG